MAAATLFQALESGYFMINVSVFTSLSQPRHLPVLSSFGEGSQIGKMQEIRGVHVDFQAQRGLFQLSSGDGDL